MKFSEHIIDRHRRWWKEGEMREVSQLSGKLAGQKYMSDSGYKVPELYGTFRGVDSIPDFSQLPANFVLKPIEGSNARNVFVMKNGKNLLEDKAYDYSEMIEYLHNYYKEKAPKTRFMVEELLVQWDCSHSIPLDYKFYTFGSNLAFIHVVERHNARHLNRHWFLKPDWTNLNMKIQRTQEPQPTPPPKPHCLEELMSINQTIGGRLNMFMRIDLYATNKGAVFGEFTPSPHGGTGYTEEADEWLGSLWQGKEGCLPAASPAPISS